MKNIFRVLIIVAVVGAAFFVDSKPATAGALDMTVLSPNGGETLVVGQTYRITWSAPSNIDTVWLGYSSGEGSLDWIVTGLANTGYYDWYVYVGNTTNTQFKIEAIGYDIGVGSATDLSDSYFTVVQDVAINQSVLSNPRVNQSYAATLTASGGSGTYGWSNTGSLPPGLIFAQVGNTATISGTPTAAGTYNFTVIVSSGANASSMLSDSKEFTLIVDTAGNPSVNLTVNSHASTGYQEPTVDLGNASTVTITWNATNASYCNTYGQTLLRLTDGTKWGDLNNLPTSGTRTFTTAIQKGVDGNAMTYAGIGIQCWGGPSLRMSDTKGILAVWNSTASNASLTFNTETLPATSFTPGQNNAQVLKFTATANGQVTLTQINVGITTAVGSTGICSHVSGLSLAVNGTVMATAGSMNSSCVAAFMFSPSLTISTGNPVTFSVTVNFDSTTTTGAQMYFTLSQINPTDNSVTIPGLGTVTSPLLAINSPSALSIITSVLPNAKVGQSYSVTLSATGGAAPYSWGLSSDSGPVNGIVPGLTWNSVACTSLSCSPFSGTPTIAGTYTFIVYLSSGTQTTSKQYTLTVDPASIADLYLVTTSPLGQAKVGESYSASIIAKGGTGPYSWSVLSGKLPPGLTLQPSDGKGCPDYGTYTTCALVMGTPTTAGTYVFDAYVIGSMNKGVSRALEITVNPAGNQKPIGWVDSLRDGFISGWAVDSDNPEVPLNIHFYFDSKSATPWSTATDVQRDDVNLIMGSTGTHGFKFSIPEQYRDGKRHTVYVYAIDIDDGTGSSNPQLYGSPKTFSLSKTTPATVRHARGAIVIGEGGTVYFLGAEIRYPFPSPEVFFSWGHKFSDLVLANSADLALPVGPVAQMK